MGCWPKGHDPSVQMSWQQRRVLNQNGYAELLPSYESSLSAVRRGKRRTREADQLVQLRSCEKDITDTLAIIRRRAKAAYFGDVLALNKKINEILTEDEVQILQQLCYKSLRETSANMGMDHKLLGDQLLHITRKVQRACDRRKNPVCWFLDQEGIEIYGLLLSQPTDEAITEVLSITSEQLHRQKSRIKFLQGLLSNYDIENLHRALSVLSIEQRMIYIMAESGLRNVDIANRIGTTPNTVGVQKQRISQKLKTINKTHPI